MSRTTTTVVHRPSARPVPSPGAWDFTEAWLANRRLSEHTRLAYRRDIAGWLAWCAQREGDPLRVTFLDVNEYGRELERRVDGRSGRTLTAATVARKLSALSSWFDFLVRLGVVVANPVAAADRPRVDRDHSVTVGLTSAEVDALVSVALAQSGPTAARNRVVVLFLADLGLRVGELVSLNLEDLGQERGHRSVRFVGKGGRSRRRALTPGAVRALDAYLVARAAAAGLEVAGLSGPLLTTSTGGRLDRHAVFRLVRRLAREAGLPAWSRLSPHSLRHAFATTARAEGVALEDVQDAMGHADPRTTRRYDRDRHNLDRDPAYVIAEARQRRG